MHCTTPGWSKEDDGDGNSGYTMRCRGGFQLKHQLRASIWIILLRSDEVWLPEHPWLSEGESPPPCSQCRCWLRVPPATWLPRRAPHHTPDGWWHNGDKIANMRTWSIQRALSLCLCKPPQNNIDEYKAQTRTVECCPVSPGCWSMRSVWEEAGSGGSCL